jgi:hypothetical protein
MKADIGRSVDSISKIKRVIRLFLVFGKGKTALSQPDKIPVFHPSCQVIPVKARLPCIYLMDVKVCQIEHLILEFQKSHSLFCFYYAINIYAEIANRESKENQQVVLEKTFNRYVSSI